METRTLCSSKTVGCSTTNNFLRNKNLKSALIECCMRYTSDQNDDTSGSVLGLFLLCSGFLHDTGCLD